jgi:serine phosphatase RsbU (regulator of sigma subunit)
MDFLERPSEVNRAIDDTLFDLASSANYLINHALKNESNLEKQEVYYSPDGITIEKNPQNLSIFYDGKLLQVDRDFNVVKNELDRHEIKELVQKIALIKEQSKELDRTKQIEQNRGLSL